MTDPISDFLTRVRNSLKAGQAECVVPHSILKAAIAGILKNEGYILDSTEGLDEAGHKTVVLKLKYVDNTPAITNLRRNSTPGCRLYYGYREIPRVLNGLGISIVSTSKGPMKDQDARRLKLGGELLCSIW